MSKRSKKARLKKKERLEKKLTALSDEPKKRLHPATTRSIWAIALACVAVILVLAYWQKAGPAGIWIYNALTTMLGWGYFILPASLLLVSGVFLFSYRHEAVAVACIGATFLVLSILGLIEILSPTHGGWLGLALGSLAIPFGQTAAIIINVVIFIIAVLVTTNTPIQLTWPFKREDESEEGTAEEDSSVQIDERKEQPPAPEVGKDEPIVEEEENNAPAKKKSIVLIQKKFHDYVPPPLSLLKSSIEKPTTGDLRANANIIKRTLESFGIVVEMGEINIGPKVTRYTLKPAEGMKLSRITALNPDLALALAAHPIRIEAPIPGKSLVGIEVPNKSAALVRLGSLMAYPEFQASGLLGFALGRDVSGEPLFPNIEKMPHLLVAGATGSGKSILIHSIITSLLYKNSPSSLKLILIDPKKVELTMYGGLPHLVLPVITENKKALGVFRWAIAEMERRYELLSTSGSRDVKSYNGKNQEEALPYIAVIVDEMADLMASYGREIEGSVIRLAQMARATGIHLILSTQRPSVEVITGLIKANITNRVALQVASQIDSRTILDMAGAEKLLGGGDLLFVSQELSKPRRIQGSYITEDEIANVTEFIREHNKVEIQEIDIAQDSAAKIENEVLDGYLEEDEDELYDEAVAQVTQAQKASASLLQRRLKVGYARAARLLDLMEANGLVGPGEGAKPRDVYLEKIPDAYKNG